MPMKPLPASVPLRSETSCNRAPPFMLSVPPSMIRLESLVSSPATLRLPPSMRSTLPTTLRLATD